MAHDVLVDRGALLLALKATFAEGAQEILDKQGKATLPSEGFVRISKIIKPDGVLPIGRTRWYAGINAGFFPGPVKVGNASLWKVQDIRKLLSAVAAGKFREAPTLRTTGTIVEGRRRQRNRKARRDATAGGAPLVRPAAGKHGPGHSPLSQT